MQNTKNTQKMQDEAIVTAYLKQHPKFLSAFLANHPEMVKNMVFPSTHQNGVTDFHNFKTQKLEKDLLRLKAKNRQLLDMSVDNLKSQEQIHTLVLDVLNAPSLEALLQHLKKHLQEEMAVDFTHLCLLKDGPFPVSLKKHHTPVEEGLINCLFKTPETFVSLRTLYEDSQKAIHGTWANKAASDALLKIQTPQGTTLGFLALVSQEKERFHQGQGTELLVFIAHIIGHVMANWVTHETMQKTG